MNVRMTNMMNQNKKKKRQFRKEQLSMTQCEIIFFNNFFVLWKIFNFVFANQTDFFMMEYNKNIRQYF